MFKNIITKTLYDKKAFLIGWSIGLSVMAVITVAFFPVIKDQMGDLFASVPKSLESLTGSPDDYKNIIGYVATGVFDSRIPMIALVMAIILGVNIGVGEESSEKLYQLLALPVSRSKIVVHKWLAMMLIFAITHIALLAGIALVCLMIGESLPPDKLLVGIMLSYLLTSAIGSMTLSIGFSFGRRGLTTAVAAGYAFTSYILTSLAAQVQWLEKIDYLSIFHYYKASAAIKSEIEPWNIIFLVVFNLAFLALAMSAFSRRDVGINAV